MKENENIDDLFRSAIEPVNTDLPENGWSVLNNALDKRQAMLRKQKRNWGGALLLLLLLVSFETYQVYSPSDNLVADKNNQKPIEQRIRNSSLAVNKNEKVANNKSVNNTIVKDKIESAVDDKNSRTSTSQQASIGNLIGTANSPINEKSSPVVVAKNKSVKADLSLRASPHIKQSEKADADLNVGKNNISLSPVASANIVRDSIETKTETKPQNDLNDSVEITADVKPVNSKADAKTITDSTKQQTGSNQNDFKNSVAITADVKPAHVKKHNKIKSDETKNTVDTRKNNAQTSPNNNNVITSHDKTAEAPAKQNNTNSTSPSKTDSVKASLPLAITSSVEPIKDVKSSIPFIKRITSHLSFNVFYSPDKAKRYLKQDNTYNGSASSQTDYYNTEKSKFSYSTGARIGYLLGGRWSIASGCTYSTYSQEASSDNIYVQSESEYLEEHNGHEPGHGQGHGGGHGGGNGGGWHGGGHGGGNGSGNSHNDSLHFIIHTSCGTIDLDDPISDEDAEEGETLHLKTTTTQVIQFINIPLMVRFQIARRKFGYYVNAGGIANIAIKDKVTVDIENYGSQTSNIDGLKKMSYSLLFDAGVEYKFYRKLNVFVEPNFRYSVTPINQDNPIKAYPYFIGVRLGLGIHL